VIDPYRNLLTFQEHEFPDFIDLPDGSIVSLEGASQEAIRQSISLHEQMAKAHRLRHASSASG